MGISANIVLTWVSSGFPVRVSPVFPQGFFRVDDSHG
jgi:hypothetical protein